MYAIMLYVKVEVYEMNFAQKIKEIRKQLGLSQEQLAREIGVTFSTVNRWENGKTKPNNLARKVFEQFCKKNGVENLYNIDILKKHKIREK